MSVRDRQAPAAGSRRRRGSFGLRVLLWTCSILLLAQSLAPPGYMPGSLANGWPVVLCPEGLPAGFLGEASHGHHHHHAGTGSADSSDAAGTSSSDAQSYCPLGSALGQPALTGTLSAAAVSSDAAPTFLRDLHSAAKQGRFYRHHPRGPPHPIV